MSQNVSEKQRKAIDCLLSAANQTAAAACAGVNRRTLARWMAQPAFKAALRDAQGEAIKHATRRLAGALDQAVTTITHLAEAAEDEGTRLRAASRVGEMLAELRATNELEERITALEAQLPQLR